MMRQYTTSLEVGRAFEPSTDNVRSARYFVADALQAWKADVDLDAVALLTTELVTNSIVHAATEVRVALWLDDTTLRVEVGDDSDLRPHVRRPAGESTAGRGMTIVAQLCEKWGVESVPDDGKVVWCQIGVGRPKHPGMWQGNQRTCWMEGLSVGRAAK